MPRDSFTDHYKQALRVLIRVLDSNAGVGGFSDPTPSQMRRQFVLAGFFSLTMLLCEQVNRIACSKQSEPIPSDDQEYLRLILALLSHFVERSSSTPLIAAEKAGMVTNLLKILNASWTTDNDAANRPRLSDGQDVAYISEETRKAICGFLNKTACLMPVSVLRSIAQTTGPFGASVQSLGSPPAHQMTKKIFKRYSAELLASTALKAQLSNKGSSPKSTFERTVAQLISLTSLQRTVQLANAFSLCTESLKLVQELQ